MVELRGFNEEKLWRKMFMDDNEFENWLKDLGLLHRCVKIPNKMHQISKIFHLQRLSLNIKAKFFNF